LFVKTCFFPALFICLSVCTQAQNVVYPQENKPAADNGIEYGYIIKNEQVKSSGGEDYSRYELTLYITNKSGCTKLYAMGGSFSQSLSTAQLATFNVVNANGKRFTSKSSSIRARDFYITVKRKTGDKETSDYVKAGYVFRNGETLNNNVTVLVPKGEKPVVQAVANFLPELQ
jgi:hypothetical protein